MQQFLIPAKPDLQAAREGWLKMLARERRLSALTLDAYERDTRQFLHFLTGHLGGAPGPCRCRRSAACRSARLPGEPPRRRRRCAHARARPGRRPLAAALSRAAGPRQCGGRGGAARAEAAEIAAQAADGRRCQARRLGRRAARRGTMDRRAQCRGADAALRLRPAHFRGARADRGRPRQPSAMRSCASPARAARRGWCRCCRSRCKAVAEYRRLCPYHLDPTGTAVSRRARRAAAAGDHPARDAQAALGAQPARYRDAACAAPLLRHASARPRRRSAHHPGTARPCQPVDDAGLYRRRHRRGCSRSTSGRIRAPESIDLFIAGNWRYGLTVSPLFAPRDRCMKRAIAIADRVAIPLLKLIAAVNMLFLLSFLLVAGLSPRARRMPRCRCAPATT